MLPLIVTLLAVEAIVAMLVLSEFFLIVIFPVPATTFSLKVIVKLLPTATSVALLVGLKLLAVGTDPTTFALKAPLPCVPTATNPSTLRARIIETGTLPITSALSCTQEVLVPFRVLVE